MSDTEPTSIEGPSSMTGFGRGSASNESYRVDVEMKAVNHRYLDPSLRLPREWADLEPVIREVLRRHFQRGRIEVQLRVDSIGRSETGVRIDRELARTIRAELGALAADLGVQDDLGITALSRYQEVFSLVPAEPEQQPEQVANLVEAAVEAAAQGLLRMRRQEGAVLVDDLRPRLADISRLVEQVAASAPAVVRDYADKLRGRVRQLLDASADGEVPSLSVQDGRLEMEVALLADRCDVTEEITRARAHLDAMAGLLDADSGMSVGRRLDFLCQELFRELNTMGNKSSSVEVSPIVVDAKAELEKVREQVQNLE